MELKLERVQAAASARVLDTEVAQAAEHDFYLPDYCPDIFRVLRCSMTPGVVSTAINGGRLSFDLSVVIRVIYRSPEGGGVYCVEHTQEYTKTVELPPDTVSPSVTVTPCVQSVNCRVADKRRLEVRGSISCRVCADGEQTVTLLTGASGGGIQLRREQAVYPSKRLTAAKRITVIEELELAQGKPPFGNVMRCGVAIEKGEQRVISGKLVAGGEARVNLLYLPKDGGSPETMRFAIPFSQIIDIEGLEDSFDTDVSITAAKCVITQGSDGLLECELVMLVNVTAQRFETAELVTDAYSTRCETVCTRAENAVISPPERASVSCTAACVLTSSEGEAARVCDLWCEDVTSYFRRDEESGKGFICGKLTFCMLAFLSDGTAVCAEREAPFEQEITGIQDIPDTVRVTARVTGCSYSLGEGGAVSAKAELELSAVVSRSGGEGLITDITADESRPRQCDKGCAVRICYTGGEDESLWEIAKRYSTGVQPLIDENPVSGGGRRVLLIPMNDR